jgi:phage/plasmid-like protein (TIGR03299 family)
MTWKNEKPWQGIGVEVDSKLSAREMLGKAKIDRQVSKNKRLKSIENERAFRFFKSFAEAGDASIDTIGSLENERIVWALARLNEGFSLDKVDKVEGYLLLSSRQENRESIQILFLTVREVCNSTYPIAIKARTTFRNTFLTDSKFPPDMEKKAKETLALGRTAISAFQSDAERLAKKTVDEKIANRYVFDVFQPETSKELSEIGPKEIGEHAEEKTMMTITALGNAPGNDLKTAHNTAWGLLNAVTHTVDHRLGNNQDLRLKQAWFGSSLKIKQRALEQALALLAP